MKLYNLHKHSIYIYYDKNFDQRQEISSHHNAVGICENDVYAIRCMQCNELYNDYKSNYFVNNFSKASLFTVKISSIRPKINFGDDVTFFELLNYNGLLLLGTKTEIISYIIEQYNTLNDNFISLKNTNTNLDSNIKKKEGDIENLKKNLETEKKEKNSIFTQLKNVEKKNKDLSFYLKEEKDNSSKLEAKINNSEIEIKKLIQKNEDLNKTLDNESREKNEKMKNIENQLEKEMQKTKSLELQVSQLQKQERQNNIKNRELEENLMKNEKENKNLINQNKVLSANVENLKKNLSQKENEIKEINNSLNKEKDSKKEILKNLNDEKDKNKKMKNKLDNISIENNNNVNKVLVQLEEEKQKTKSLEIQVTKLKEQEKNNVIKFEELQKKSQSKEKELKDLNNEKDKQKMFGIKFETDSKPGDYDIILDITSFQDLINKGWLIYYNLKEGKKKYQEKKEESTIIVGVIGNGNKGKSFFLEKLSGYDIPKGFNTKTKGLSIRYGTSSDHNVAILDSAGQETPLLKVTNDNKINEKILEGDINDKEEININQKEEKDDENTKNIQNQANEKYLEQKVKKEANENAQNNNSEKKEQLEEEDIEFEQYSRDKLITEFFLQKFIIWKSNILILVVGSISLTEQKLLSRVRAEVESMDKDKQIYVIHNLKNFSTQEQVNDYIENTLKKLYKIEIEEIKKQNIMKKNGEKEDDDNNYFNTFFVEKGKKVIHFLFINEYSEKAKYYNVPTIEFIQKEIEVIKIRNNFSIIDDCKKFLVKISEEIMEENPKSDKLITIEGEKYGRGIR